MLRRLFTGFVFILGMAAIASGLISAFNWNKTWRDRIYPGVRVEEIRLGGLTEREAERQLAPVAEGFLSSTVTLILDGHSWQVSRRELGFQFDPAEHAHRAYLANRSGPVWRRGQSLWQAFYSNIDVPLKVSLDTSRAESVLQGFAKSLYLPPENARLIVDDRNQVKVVQGKPGKVLDLDASLKALEQNLYPFEGVLELHLVEQQPQVTTQDVLGMKISGLLASYTTYFDAQSANRTYNINVAADALDNSLIKPGEVFSFNRIVGPRSQEAGYKEALIIEHNRFTPGIGGGVCQVSSTLYNTALLAGLEIVERSNHSLPVVYVPMGRDATVVYGAYDLRFRNNTSGYLYIKTRVSGGALSVSILGNTAEKKKITLESVVDKVLDFKVINKEDPALYVGKTVVESEGVKGYQVRVFKIANGARTLLSNDLYEPLDKIVHSGTMPVPVTPAPPSDQNQQAPA